MEIKYHEITWMGPSRQKNEDALGYLQPHEIDERRWRGVACVICDGVGGHGRGDVASQLAVRKAFDEYLAATPTTSPAKLIRHMFNAANLAVYDAGMKSESQIRMGTTMTVSLLRNDQAVIGHVGDCRVYHIHGGEMRRVTTDHSYSGMQMKMGLINAQEAADSQLRHVLTRSLGREPIVQVDIETVQLWPGDILVQCCDGVYSCMSEQELFDKVKQNPDGACQALIELCDRRGADDNVSVQVIQVRKIERVQYVRGLPLYSPIKDPTMDQELHVDEVLDGRYQILNQISKSGMASIYHASDVRTGREVALKVPYLQFESDPNFYERFRREQEIGERLNHPSIIHIEAPSDLEKSRPYLVMEYLDGQTLGHVMKSVKPMPEADALKIAARLCEALQYLHENQIVHRDLKPDNIMICDDGTLRLMDFGIAKVAGARRLTFGKFQPAMGTPDYMSPEQVRGARGDNRTDLYSLGAILYEMVTGFPPFEGNNPLAVMNGRLTGDPIAPRERNPDLSPAAEEIILHAMARDPEHRYASAALMRKDLEHPADVQITDRASRLEPPKAATPTLTRFVIPVGIAIFVIAVAITVAMIKFRIHIERR